MIQSRVIPCLLLKGCGLYKTIKFKNPVYIGDPINAVRIFNDKGVDELVILDIEASLTQRGPNFELIADIASEAFIPLCYGGGVRSIDDFTRLFKLGVEKVSLNSAAVNTPDLIESAAKKFGRQSIVVSIDAKKTLLGRYETYINSGRENAKMDPVAAAKRAEELGAGEILLYAMDRDGTMQGLDIPLINRVTEAVSIPVVASGGASSLKDIAAAVHQGGASAVAAGSMFVFQGKHKAVLITYPTEEEIAAALRR
ncbi:MAG TPA: AglZ/HisF2 family acetamidino modification protein [Burkholderiales bacterium]|nr:AglZ/HisF2 family acetamidino modification protein [Burkholderiales bacterium]